MADVTVQLTWLGDALRFEGGAVPGPSITVDGNGTTAPSPVQLLALSLAACSGADVVEILGKMRVPLSGLQVRIEGERRPEPPRRYTSLRIYYEASGIEAADRPKLERAVALSHEKYCSVMHTLRQDLELNTELKIV